MSSFESLSPLHLSVLLYSVLGLLLLVLLLLLTVNRKLNQILPKSEKVRIDPRKKAKRAEASKSFFEEFLSEDPKRSELTKKEQFEAYREWRKQKGLNWSN